MDQNVKPKPTWEYHSQKGVASVSVSASGDRVLAGTLDKQVLCFDSTGHLLWPVPVGNQAWRVAFSGDGQTAAVGTGSTRPWDMRGRGVSLFDGQGELLWQKDLGASVWGLSLSADGSTLAVGTSSQELRLYNRQGSLLWQHRIPGLSWSAWVWATALSADGEIVALGSADKSIQILNRNGNLLGTHKAEADVFTVAVSADGQTIAAGSSDQHVYLLNSQGQLLWRESLADKVWAVALSADGEQVVVGADAEEAHLRIFDRAGRPIWKRYVEGDIAAVAVSAQGETVAVGTRAGHISIFNGTGKPLLDYVVSKNVRDVAVSADGHLIVACAMDGGIYGFTLPQSELSPFAQAAKTTNNLTEVQPMSGIPPQLYRELQEVLLKCSAFDSNGSLRNLFIDDRLSPWKYQISDADNASTRVQSAISTLYGKSNTQGQNALVLLLHVLRDNTPPGDGLVHELDAAANKLQQVVGGTYKPSKHTVFDMQNQQVGTQVNVAGNYYAAPSSGNSAPPSSQPAQGGISTAASGTAELRSRLSRLDVVELESLCMDHFPKVYDKFSRGMRRDEMINLLLDYCRRNSGEATRLAGLL